jgi:hypothetical protein
LENRALSTDNAVKASSGALENLPALRGRAGRAEIDGPADLHDRTSPAAPQLMII